MIDVNEIFFDSDKAVALWCDDVPDTNDLAAMAADIVQMNNIDLISLSPNMVRDMWVFLEKKPIKILTRYNFISNRKNIDKDVSELGKNIKDICKHGADGVQIFVKMNDLKDFIEKISPVKPDLFYEKDLYVFIDIMDVNTNNINTVFEKLKSVDAKALGLTLNEDMGNRSDFVGRVYGILQNWDFGGELHFILNNNYERIDQVVRLIESEKPELQERVKFFLEY